MSGSIKYELPLPGFGFLCAAVPFMLFFLSYEAGGWKEYSGYSEQRPYGRYIKILTAPAAYSI